MKLIIPLAPVPKGRGRAYWEGGTQRVGTPAKTKAFERAARFAMLGHTPMRGALVLSATFKIKRPKGSKREWPNVRPDLTNYLKSAEDAANGMLWLDDGQICELHAVKVYCGPGEEPCIELEVTEL